MSCIPRVGVGVPPPTRRRLDTWLLPTASVWSDEWQPVQRRATDSHHYIMLCGFSSLTPLVSSPSPCAPYGAAFHGATDAAQGTPHLAAPQGCPPWGSSHVAPIAPRWSIEAGGGAPAQGGSGGGAAVGGFAGIDRVHPLRVAAAVPRPGAALCG